VLKVKTGLMSLTVRPSSFITITGNNAALLKTVSSVLEIN